MTQTARSEASDQIRVKITDTAVLPEITVNLFSQGNPKALSFLIRRNSNRNIQTSGELTQTKHEVA